MLKVGPCSGLAVKYIIMLEPDNTMLSGCKKGIPALLRFSTCLLLCSHGYPKRPPGADLGGLLVHHACSESFPVGSIFAHVLWLSTEAGPQLRSSSVCGLLAGSVERAHPHSELRGLRRRWRNNEVLGSSGRSTLSTVFHGFRMCR